MTRIVPILCILVILPAARAGELYWSAPVTIAEATGLVNGQQLGSDLAVDGEGTWFAVWADRYYVSDDAYHHIYGATSTDNGQTWSERITVASPGGGYPHVAYADNVWGITAYSTADKTLYFYRSTDLLNWSAPIALQYDPGMVSIDRHDLEVDAAGRTWMVTWREWDEENPFDKRVWCSRSGDGGLTWSSAGPLGHHFEDAAHQGIDSGVATDGQGTWVCIWRSAREDVPGVTLGLDTDLLFASSTDDALTWSDAAAVDLAHSVSDSESEGNPTLCWAGGLFLVVFMYGEGDPPIRYAYSASPDGLTWSPFAETGLRTYWDDVTMLAGDGRGNWALAWRYDRNVIAAAPLEVARVGDSLHFESGQRSVLFESPDHEAFSPAICTDAMGHWVARWATRPTSVLSLSEGMPVAAPSIAGPSGDLDETFSLQSSAATGTPVTSVLFWRGLE